MFRCQLTKYQFCTSKIECVWFKCHLSLFLCLLDSPTQVRVVWVEAKKPSLYPDLKPGPVLQLSHEISWWLILTAVIPYLHISNMLQKCINCHLTASLSVSNSSAPVLTWKKTQYCVCVHIGSYGAHEPPSLSRVITKMNIVIIRMNKVWLWWWIRRLGILSLLLGWLFIRREMMSMCNMHEPITFSSTGDLFAHTCACIQMGMPQ